MSWTLQYLSAFPGTLDMQTHDLGSTVLCLEADW